MIIQFCGLSGSGKTTLALMAKEYFEAKNKRIEIIDGDEYRKYLTIGLGFSREDRNSNIRRLAFVAAKFAQHNIIPIISAINPYDEIRKEITANYLFVKTVYIKCSIDELTKRDTKGLYAKAKLPDEHTDKIKNLSGVNDPFEIPENPDIIIETDKETVSESTQKLIKFIELNFTHKDK
jgi:adenylylsulfate kinase